MDEEEEHLHKAESSVRREFGKWSNVLIATVTVIPDLKITISGRGAERLVKQLPEQVRTCVTLVNSITPDKIER